MRLKIQIITLVLEQSYIPSLNYIYTPKEATETRMFLLFYYEFICKYVLWVQSSLPHLLNDII